MINGRRKHNEAQLSHRSIKIIYKEVCSTKAQEMTIIILHTNSAHCAMCMEKEWKSFRMKLKIGRLQSGESFFSPHPVRFSRAFCAHARFCTKATKYEHKKLKLSAKTMRTERKIIITGKGKHTVENTADSKTAKQTTASCCCTKAVLCDVG